MERDLGEFAGTSAEFAKIGVIPPANWPTRPELGTRLAAAETLLHNCTMCELRCGVDRTAGKVGRCRLGVKTRVYGTDLQFTPEIGVVLSLHFWGNNFHCPWFAPAVRRDRGRVLQSGVWAAELRAAVDGGVRMICFAGGEPTLHVHTLLALAAAADHPLPMVLGTNAYMTPAVLELLDGVVARYVADFAFGSDECARRYAEAADYVAVVTRNLRAVAARADVLVRHLLLPGHAECCFRPVVDWLATNLPGVRFQLDPGYIPRGAAARDARIGRLNSRREVEAARKYLAGRRLQVTMAETTKIRVGVI